MKIGNAPCSWGVFYPTGNTLTGADYLDAVARAGYRVTELGPLGFLGEDAAWIDDQLKAHGLELAGAAQVHTLADARTGDALIAILHRQGRLLSALGAGDLVLMDESEWYPTDRQGVVDAAGWSSAMAKIRSAHALMRDDYGIRLHVHPHVGTCIERDDQIDRLLSETDVTLCLDTGHHAYWDQDVLASLERVWSRIGMIHLKNVDPTIRALALSGELGMDAAFAQGVMAPLSEGAVDIPSVIHFLKTKGYEGYCIVEQDPAEGAAMTPETLARNNLAYLSALLAA